MNVSIPYRLAEGMAIRAERFGALLYGYENRRLYFIHSHDIADFVTALDGSASLDEAIQAFVNSRDLDPSAALTLRSTMSQLETLGIVEAIEPAPLVSQRAKQ